MAAASWLSGGSSSSSSKLKAWSSSRDKEQASFGIIELDQVKWGEEWSHLNEPECLRGLSGNNASRLCLKRNCLAWDYIPAREGNRDDLMAHLFLRPQTQSRFPLSSSSFQLLPLFFSQNNSNNWNNNINSPWNIIPETNTIIVSSKPVSYTERQRAALARSAKSARASKPTYSPWSSLLLILIDVVVLACVS